MNLRNTEAEARIATWRAYLRRNVGRLFELPMPAVETREHWDALTRAYYGKAVGIVPRLDSEHTCTDFSSEILVGVWTGVKNGGIGVGVAIEHFDGPGMTTYRSPLRVEYVHVLGWPWQLIADRQLEPPEDWFED